ncbi:MAG: UDP-3-O-acyl-N-acetylglucosamine deacetylase [Bacteroidales bacterium]
MQELQRTLKKTYFFEGKGLHSGQNVKMELKPASVDTGIRFLRKDLGENVYLPALADYVTHTERGTTLEKDGVKVSTIEHVLATFLGLGVDNAVIELDNFEAPIMDGSALPYVKAICADGLIEQDKPRKYYQIKEEIRVKDEKSGAEVVVMPSDDFSIDISVDYNSKVLGVQKAHFDKGTDFAEEIAPCRTFVFFHELAFLFQHNLIKGGDLENAIVIVEKEVPQEELNRMADLFNVERIKRLPEGYLDNVNLRYPDECGRHKLLDVLGDFSLIGLHIKGKVIAEKTGHQLNTRAAKCIREIALKEKNSL